MSHLLFAEAEHLVEMFIKSHCRGDVISARNVVHDHRTYAHHEYAGETWLETFLPVSPNFFIFIYSFIIVFRTKREYLSFALTFIAVVFHHRSIASELSSTTALRALALSSAPSLKSICIIFSSPLQVPALCSPHRSREPTLSSTPLHLRHRIIFNPTTQENPHLHPLHLRPHSVFSCCKVTAFSEYKQ